MINNLYTIQIKKGLLLDFILGAVKIIILFLIMLVPFLMTKERYYNYEDFIFSSGAVITAIVLFLILFAQLGWTFLYLKSIKYSLEGKNINFSGGIISRFERVIPYSKVQHAIIYESLWQRILGLSSVSVETARESGIVSTGLFIPDLKREEAQKLKDKIISTSNNYKSIAGI